MRHSLPAPLSRLASLLVFSLVYAFSMPTVANAFLGFLFDKQLSGTYIRSNEQGQDVPSNFIEFSGGSYTATMGAGTPASHQRGIEKGKYSINADSIEFVSSDGTTRAYKLSSTENTITFNDGKSVNVTFVRTTKERAAALGAYRAELQRKAEEEYKARQARIAEEARKEEAWKAEKARWEEAVKAEEARREEGRKAEEARKATEEALRANGGRRLRELGFTALSESRMNWADAKAFCQQKGGRLPHINNSESFTRSERDKITHIDGFGAEGRPWAEVGLPSGYEYWTGTEYPDNPRYSWFVYSRDGKVFITDGVGYYNKFNYLRVVCVP